MDESVWIGATATHRSSSGALGASRHVDGPPRQEPGRIGSRAGPYRPRANVTEALTARPEQSGSHTGCERQRAVAWRASGGEFRRTLLTRITILAVTQAAGAGGDRPRRGARGAGNRATDLAERLGQSSQFGPFARSVIEVPLLAEPEGHLVELTDVLAETTCLEGGEALVPGGRAQPECPL